MICPSCGFEQPAGETCSQCQTPMTPAFKESPSTEPKQSAAPTAVAAKPVAEPPAPPKPSVSSKAEVSKPHSEPPKKVEEKEKALPPAPEKHAQEKKEHVSGGSHDRLEQLERLIVTSTPQIEGRQILAYYGIVSTTVFVRGDLVKERLDNVTGEVISIRSTALEVPFEKAITIALTDLKVEAAKRGANAVVGLTMNQTSGIGGIWLCLVGTAVTLKE
ncbi:MAG: heavy metal-binding domain-containing protein [Nitrospira sp.]|nr:heavy metal-binding domain-containing protein [Nitrospira sp.]